MGVFLNQVSSPTCYHPPIQKREIQKQDTLYDLSLVYSKYLNLLRLPFRTVSVALGWVKYLPIGDEAKAIIATQDQFNRIFNSTLNLPRFFISQIGFYNHSTKLLKEFGCQETEGNALIGPRLSDFFFSSLSLSLSSIKVLQLCEKFNWIHLAKRSARLPSLLAKSSNLLTLAIVGRGLVNSIILLNDQVKADYSSQTWSQDGLSPRTMKTISSVAAKSLSFFYISTTTASLYFGVYANPFLLMGISTTSLLLNLTTNKDTYKKMIWGPSPARNTDYTHYLPA